MHKVLYMHNCTKFPQCSDKIGTSIFIILQIINFTDLNLSLYQSGSMLNKPLFRISLQQILFHSHGTTEREAGCLDNCGNQCPARLFHSFRITQQGIFACQNWSLQGMKL